MNAILSILLVDDDHDDQFVFKDAMQAVNPSVVIEMASDGVEAIEKLTSGNKLPMVIFLDLNMPRMNGKKFLEEIKKNPQLSSIPVIVYSTSSVAEDIEETKALGAIDFIVKPHSYEELCNILRNALQKHGIA